MKRNYFFLIAFLLGTIGWQANAQAVNEPANWPNANWVLDVIEHTGSNAQDIEADPTTAANFAYDDDDTGSGSHDIIAAESPVIDLTAAQAAGENYIIISGGYVYNNINNDEYLAIEYWDADAGTWSLFYQFPNADTPGAPLDNFCSGTPEAYDVSIDISGFTATQLAGFKYRFIYNDNTTGGDGWRWGFCFSSPTISSSSVISPVFSVSLDPDCANSQFNVIVDITDLGGSNSVTVSDDQGSTSQQLSAPGQVTFGPYASGTTVNFTVTSDDNNSISATDMISYTCPTTAGDDCYNALAATVYAVGASAGNEVSVDTSTLTDSGAHSTCDDSGTNLDIWFMVTVPAGQTGFNVLFGGDKADKVESALWDSCGGAELACNAATSDEFVAFTGLTGGQTYYVQLWVDESNSGIFTVAFEELPQAPDCAENPSPADGSTVVLSSGRVVQLNWDAPTNGPAPTHYRLQIGVTPGTYVFDDTFDVTTLTLPLAIGGLDDATTYYWKVTPVNNGAEATGCPEWSFTSEYPAPPANDTCAGAIALTVDPDTCGAPTLTDNSFATDSGEAAPSCANYNGGDLWFTVTIPASGSVTITTSSTGSMVSDTGMAVYSGTCGSLTELECDDDDGDGLFSQVELTGQTPGDIVYVRVWEYGNDRFGEFAICAFDPIAAIADNQIAGFKFYPNPVNNTLNISAKDNIEAVSITNVMGQEVLRVSPEATQTQIDMSHLQNGVYFVKAQVNGEMTAFKVIKK